MKLIYTILLVATSIGCWAKGIRGTIVDEIGQPPICQCCADV